MGTDTFPGFFSAGRRAEAHVGNDRFSCGPGSRRFADARPCWAPSAWEEEPGNEVSVPALPTADISNQPLRLIRKVPPVTALSSFGGPNGRIEEEQKEFPKNP